MRTILIAAAVAFLLFFAVSCGTTGGDAKSGIENADSLLQGEPGQQGAAAAVPQETKTAVSGEAGGEKTAEKEEPAEPAAKLDRNTVAVIGKYVMTKERYKIITDYMRQKYDYKLTPEQEKEFIDFVINKKLMAMEARSKGYADREDIKVKYEWDFDDIISHIYYEENIGRKTGVSAAQAQEYYNANKGDFLEIKAQHMLIKSKDMANNLYKRVIAGESFDDLAKKYSEDDTTKESGGNLGFFSKGAMVKEFEDAAFALSRDEVSPPVKTVYGWHIIKVLDKRQISFDDSRDKIINMMKENKTKEVFDKAMSDLRKKYKVQVNEDAIK
jgi:hypothetical protein